MKKVSSIALVVVIASVFSSCKNSFDLIKRRYSGGYYIGLHSKKTHTEEHKKIYPLSEPDQLAGALFKTEKEEKNKQDMTASINNMPVLTNKELRKEPAEPFNRNSSSGTDQKNRKKNISEPDNTKPSKFYQDQQKTGDASNNMVVLVILCIFIPPLAVYLKEDKIETHFWIDLILCLLFWFPGIIFAFLVCFNVI